MVPGAFTTGTNHFSHGGRPDDEARAAEYADGPYKDVPDLSLKGLASLEPADADVAEVARAIVQAIDLPFGKRPFRVTIDPSSDGAEVVNMRADRVRAEMDRRIGLADLLRPPRQNTTWEGGRSRQASRRAGGRVSCRSALRASSADCLPRVQSSNLCRR